MDSVKACFKLIVIWTSAIIVFASCITLFMYVISCHQTECVISVDGKKYVCESYTEGYDLNGDLTRIRLYTDGKETIVNVDTSSVITISKTKETISFKEWLTSETLKDGLKNTK